jgi:hypothetical protein
VLVGGNHTRVAVGTVVAVGTGVSVGGGSAVPAGMHPPIASAAITSPAPMRANTHLPLKPV